MNSTITKNNLSDTLSTKHKISKTLAYSIVCDLFDTMKNKVLNDYRIEVRNFGVFTKKITEAREGRNPQNGEPIKISAKTTIKFKPSKVIQKN